MFIILKYLYHSVCVKPAVAGVQAPPDRLTNSSLITIQTQNANQLFFSDQITNNKAHNSPIALFYCPTLHRTVTQVIWNVLAWTMLPFPSVYDFILQKDIPVFCRNVYFFPREGGYYGLNQLIDVTARDR